MKSLANQYDELRESNTPSSLLYENIKKFEHDYYELKNEHAELLEHYEQISYELNQTRKGNVHGN